MLTSRRTTSGEDHGMLSHPRDDIAVAHMATINPTTTGTTRAQQEWLRLFELPHHHNYYQHERTAPTAPPVMETLSIIGGDFNFVETQAWLRNIVYVANNLFAASQSYPVSKRYSSYLEDCGCAGERCISDYGTRHSSYINVNQAIVCNDSICFVGPISGNRMKQRYNLDLISTRVGLGVMCNATIPKDAFIIEYVGEILLGTDATKRRDKRYQVATKAKASWEGPIDVFIDAARCDNESRFINHSCSPNCGLFELEWTNTSRLGIFAKADIPPLRELMIRYRKSNLSLFACQCGRTTCISNCA
ncbi:histone H3-K9 methyltransferase KMT1 [Phytophthora pseudosyringae]|uniref:Histone H3-K9 methyltransferase KMT1 n=1 Tax=Phytophthora pseudosyringae TaxID=221518 RepID=A0A8T1VBF9_9STRA|nr:histone H3-K9 methyltransferase KMT1 [Phytophthora pseudosyringae]